MSWAYELSDEALAGLAKIGPSSAGWKTSALLSWWSRSATAPPSTTTEQAAAGDWLRFVQVSLYCLQALYPGILQDIVSCFFKQRG